MDCIKYLLKLIFTFFVWRLIGFLTVIALFALTIRIVLSGF